MKRKGFLKFSFVQERKRAEGKPLRGKNRQVRDWKRKLEDCDVKELGGLKGEKEK